jgi:hypothetical protein
MKAAIAAALCLLFAATGAASAGEGLLGRLFGGGDRTDVPKSIWQREKDASGRHLQTRLKCPPSAGAFKLTGLLASDGFGFDVWCQYDTTTRERITVFLTWRQGESLEDHFEGAKSAITTTVPGATPVASGEQASFTADPAWLSAVYDDGPFRTGVWVTDFSGWTFKFRATYAPAQQQAAFDAMSEIGAAASASAGAHLAACAAAPTPQRTGQPLDTTKMATHITGISALTHYIFPERPEPEPIWCVERAFANLTVPLQLWRNVGARGDSTAVQRFTLMTLEMPPAFDVVASRHATETLTKASNVPSDSLRAHILLATLSGTPGVFSFFDGEPDPEMVATALANIVSSRATPAIYYSDRDKKIVIMLPPPLDIDQKK